MKDFFATNRRQLMEKVKGGVVAIAGYTQMQRANDMAFRFEQESNFWWLTGIEESDWQLIIDGTRQRSWLVMPSLSDVRAVFEGGLDAEEARKVSGVDEVISPDEAARLLRQLAKKHSVVHSLGDLPHADYYDFSLNPAPKKLYEQLSRIFSSVQDCRKDLHQLRAIKRPEEITMIKKAVTLTIDAFEAIKPRLEAMSYEYEVEAEFSHYFRLRGAKGHAYDPIVATGKNACTLHYVRNSSRLKKKDLLLLDIGARVGGYAADITRTYALGEPGQRQQAVHAAVREAQEKIIHLLKPGLLIEEYQRKVDSIMREALMQLGLVKGMDDEEAYRKYFPHAISHGLGVDVHDSLGAPRYLEAGMVITVEPGIYIPEEKIGVRIEDDIHITPKGHLNLSARLSTEW